MNNIQQIQEKVLQQASKKTIAVAVAEDEDVLEALQQVKNAGLADLILIGDKEKINKVAEKIGFDLSGYSIIHKTDAPSAARQAVSMVRKGEAHVLMKGLLETSTFLKAILDKECGLRTGNILSHLAVFEVPGLERLLLVSDCAMNIAPTLQEKVGILHNLIPAAAALGIEEPKTAAVCAVEMVNPDMPATVDAALLSKMSQRGQIKGMIIDGPLALDNSISKEAAKHKGITSPVAGQADILLFPNIETGNVFYKSLVYMAKSQSAGVILGAAAPIVLTSRSDSSQTKVNSIALSLLFSREGVS